MLNLYANGIVPTYLVDSFRIVLMSAYLGYSLWMLYRYNPNWVNPFRKETLKNPLSVVAFLFVLITFGYFSLPYLLDDGDPGRVSLAWFVIFFLPG